MKLYKLTTGDDLVMIAPIHVIATHLWGCNHRHADVIEKDVADDGFSAFFLNATPYHVVRASLRVEAIIREALTVR